MTRPDPVVVATAAAIVEASVPHGRYGLQVTTCLSCHHCGHYLHAFQAVGDVSESNEWIAYECLYCGATSTIYDRHWSPES